MTTNRNDDILPTIDGLAFGGDYNPEQWLRDVWDEDMRLMREAGVNLVTVNVFSWAGINPGPGEWDFDQLDAIMDHLHEGGVKADLATSTASPPPWFSHAHPETLPVDAETAAIFRRQAGAGEVWYLAARLADLDPFFTRLGLAPDFPDALAGLELVRRRHDDGRSYLFAINHTAAALAVPATGTDLLSGTPWTPDRSLAAGETAVIREA